EIAQRHLRRKAVAHAAGDGLREQYLTAVRRRHDSRRTIDGAAEVIAVPVFDDAAVQPAAHAKGRTAACGGIMKRALQVQSGSERRTRVVEDGVDAIAGRLDYAPAVGLDAVPRQRIVGG